MVLYARQTVIILLLLPVVLLAQFQKNNAWKGWKTYERTESVVVDTTTYLLDRYPSADLAFSLRLLDSDFVDSTCIRVRRSSDNAEQDIGFSGGVLDTASLKAFVGAGNGFVVEWHDQTSNNNTVSQSVKSNQPMIVSDGIVVRSEGLLSMDYDNLNDYLFNTVSLNLGSSARSVFAVAAPATVGIGSDFIANFNYSDLSGKSWGISPEVAIRCNGVTWVSTTNMNANVFGLVTSIFTGGNIYSGNSMWLDGNSVTRTSGIDGAIDTGSNGIIIGAFYPGGTVLPFDGTISEIIFYKSDQSANRTEIEGNINAYYGIY
jgi:hypothetical protein